MTDVNNNARITNDKDDPPIDSTLHLTPEIEAMTQVIPTSDLRPGDGIWSVIHTDGTEEQISSGREVDSVEQVNHDGRIGTQFVYHGDWVDGGYADEKFRITKRN